MKYLDDSAKAETYNDIGNNYRKIVYSIIIIIIYYLQNDNDRAVENYKLALKYETDDKKIGKLYKVIGNTYFHENVQII